MRVIFLNTWYGKLRAELRAYVMRKLPDTDVFCFQEAYPMDRAAYEDLLENDFTMYDVSKTNAEKRIRFANVMYVRNGISVDNLGTLFEQETDYEDAGLALYADLISDNGRVTICTMHGAPYPGDKLDTMTRLYQTRKLIEAFKDKSNVIIGGDFNLLPDTQSVKTFREYGYKDLIQEFSIPTTRNRITFEAYPDNIQHYADYAFVSPAIDVRRFEVPPVVVSDHQPLELEIALSRSINEDQHIETTTPSLHQAV